MSDQSPPIPPADEPPHERPKPRRRPTEAVLRLRELQQPRRARRRPAPVEPPPPRPSLASRLFLYEEADRRVRNDLPAYCSSMVRIADKRGQLVPFAFREAQQQLHSKLERQLEARGLVRAIVLKARRLGVSTYVGARFYHKATLSLGRNAFILTQEDKSTQELFGLVKRIHENMPADYQPATQAANANELSFAGLDGGYRVGTAKNVAGTGRALTLQLFHGSEVAFWSRAEDHFAGALKAVSLVEGTEVILESTANGVGGAFYDQWGLAERGQSDFIPIFLPWMIDPDNVRPLSDGYEPSAEELEYQQHYKLTDEQLCWAHYENINVGGEPGKLSARFRQENPATAAEAFQTTGEDSFIPAEAINRARRWKAPDQHFLPRVIGVDVARGGADRTRIVDRQGRKAGMVDIMMHTDDLMQIAHAVMKLLRDNPDICRAFIDVTGIGAGVYDTCRNSGFGMRVTGVNFGSGAQDPSRYVNRRAEMWARVKEWLLDPGGAEIPDNDVAHRHLAASGSKFDTNSRLQIEAKEDIKKRVHFSPDWGDALCLTFAELLAPDMPDDQPKWMRGLSAISDDGGDWQTL